MKQYLLVILATLTFNTHADTIGRYMNIANNIPKMEMKADKQSHTWARSARTILSLTSESIAESLILANQAAEERGSALFCLPGGISLNALMMNELIQETYREISSQESDKNNMTVSQVALIGLTRKFPCQTGSTTPTSHPTNPIKADVPNARIEHMQGFVMPPPPTTTDTPED